MQYTVCDITLFSQIFYYRIFYDSLNRASEELANPSERESLISGTTSTDPDKEQSYRSSKTFRRIVEYSLLCGFVLTFGLGAYFVERSGRSNHQDEEPSVPGDVYEWKSQVLGWLSAAMYLGSRIPQISKWSFFSRR